MRKKHEHSTSPGEAARLSEETLINIGHYHYASERYAVRLAQNQGDPDLVPQIARRLSELLADTAVRALAGDPDLVPQMRQDGFATYQRRKNQVRNVHLSEEDGDDRPSGKRTLSKKARKAISRAQHERWARYHARQEGRRKTWKEGKRKQRARRVISEEVTERGTPRKRKLTPKQLAAMRANAKKARAANRKKKHPPMSEEQRAKISAAMKAAFAEKKAGAA